ncbi:MAG: 16S rRNA (guanine(966)-N(2))-methyltransferase RsmD [Propionibacteriaceae bacterium]|jgi:16S rRNA (guanine966-N2)-methyltransferase|nr:16S rRNA (guanine(966)-N(2))-methyltransferase RsmD [Propionibacteriaceae bacterium]
MSRIIAGAAKGTAIRMPRGSATRPTTDRVREAVFNTLVDWAGSAAVDSARQFEGISFLDLYAGSGAMGLEAASRGASPVTCVERDANATKSIRDNVAALRLEVRVVANQVAQYLGGPAAPFDIIFLDPPYDTGNDEIERCLAAITRCGWFADDGVIVVERSSRSEPFEWPSEVERQWQKSYGETVIYYGDRGADPMLGETPEEPGQDQPRNGRDQKEATDVGN